MERKSKELQEDLYLEDNEIIIKEELPIVADGWQGSNKIMQALGVKLTESQNKIHETKNELKIVKKLLCCDKKNDSESDENININHIIEKLIEKGKLGFTILISSNIFLELILKQPCISCCNTDFSNCKSKINVNGLGICITSTYSLCSNVTEYCNEKLGDDFSKCLTGAALVGEEFFQGLYQAANISAENALEAYTYWASGEFIFNGELEEGNYDNSSQQMEHTILIAIAEKVLTILEKYNIKLNVGVDGDLFTNKILALLKVVNQIFADLKHKAKIVRSKIASDRNWKHLEQPIMSYYIRSSNSDTSTPTDKELAWMHTEENPDLTLSTPNLIGVDDNQCKRLLEFLKKITKLKDDQSLITTILCAAGNLIRFSDQDEKNLLATWKQREQKRQVNIAAIEIHNKIQAEKIINQKKQLEGFDYSQGYHEKQWESIILFLSGQNTLAILKTSGGKSLIYAVASILSQELIVIFTPQKALMDDQVIRMGILAAMLYASLEQPPLVQEKIFAEIASGLILPILALSATCLPSDAEIIQSVLEISDMKIIKTSIFYLTIGKCDDMTKALKKNFNPTIIGMYYGKLSSAEQTAIFTNWKNGTIKIMSAISAFGIEMGRARRAE
ncbi:hypothetical protein C1645_837918 [Glomus cerebriforme]|uniref:Helicase ATP-binding domain-containing protein n=1 Tax=Glomus cerebriforme TaxID=658196 RepID=A0A397S4D9_9GLOM|nr:hypothetical protein C1645_837918 [Glomus cerebriforme]